MSIPFNLFPATFNVPGQFVEFDSSQANTSAVTLPQQVLLVGQKLAAGTAATGLPIRVTTEDQVGALCGRGSMLHQMARKYFRGNAFTPTFILPLADKGGATKATQALTATGPATASGELALYIGDNRYGIPVALGMTAAQLATAIVAAITANDDRYIDAAVDGVIPAKVNLTARHGGLDVGYVGAVVNRYSTESYPAGIGLTIAARTEGASNPDVNAAVYTVLGDAWYPTIVMPYTDAANLAALKLELADRFGPIRQIDSYAFAAANSDVATLSTLVASNNAPWTSVVDTWDTLTPPYVVAAAVAAQDAGEPDPGRPRQTLPLPGVLAKSRIGRRTIAERNQLIGAGVSTLRVDSDGTVRIERLTSTYRLNAYGVADNAYFDTESLHLLANLRYTLRVRFANKYPRHKLGKDGSIGANVMTPSIARAEEIALYIDTWMVQGWVEGGVALDQFKRDLRCEINAGDPNRLDSLLPPDLINQLRVFAGNVQFRR